MQLNQFPLEKGVLTASQFRIIAELAHREAGLAINSNKNAMVFSRLAKRMRILGLSDVDAYCQHLSHSSDPSELSNLVCALTTNVTHFFREPHHFDILRDRFQASWTQTVRSGHPLRFWSAGCSEGMEPYSLAMLIADILPDFPTLDIRILGTDIDREMIQQARDGVYPADRLKHIPQNLRHFMVSPSQPIDKSTYALDLKWPHDEFLSIRRDIRNLVTFNTHNLVHSWPMRFRFDAIFCRNVVIYFDETTQSRLWPKFSAALGNGGLLFLGHSERLISAEDLGFENIGLTAYQKKGRVTAPLEKDSSDGFA